MRKRYTPIFKPRDVLWEADQDFLGLKTEFLQNTWAVSSTVHYKSEHRASCSSSDIWTPLTSKRMAPYWWSPL